MTVTLKQGDCLELMKELDDESVDLILTDPPYAAHFEKGAGSFGQRQYFEDVGKGVGSNVNFDIKPFLDTLIPKLRKFNAYFWCSQKQLYDYLSFAINHNYYYEILVWNKTNPIPTKNNKYLPDTEYCVFMRETSVTFNNDLPFNFYKKVFITPVNKSKYGHPTEKPLEVILPSIAISSKESDTILDPFMGSGTTGVACVQLNRNFIGYEISPDYFKIAEKRIKEAETQRKLNEFK